MFLHTTPWDPATRHEHSQRETALVSKGEPTKTEEECLVISDKLEPFHSPDHTVLNLTPKLPKSHAFLA